MNKTILVKIGSNTLLENGDVNQRVIANVAENIDRAIAGGYSVVVISSGAVAAWKTILWKEIPEWISETKYKQMCSAVGQRRLMDIYANLLWVYKRNVAQALVTQDTFRIESQKRNFIEVLQWLTRMGVVTIVNENDVLSSEEIVFSDNDSLAEKVWILLWVEKVIILSNVGWLHDKHPNKWWVLISKIIEITDETYAMADDETSPDGKWGMKSKIDTAKALLDAGITMHLADGRERDIVSRILSWEMVGTVFKK